RHEQAGVAGHAVFLFELGDRAGFARCGQLALEVAQRPVAVGQTPQCASSVPGSARLLVTLRRPLVELNGNVVLTGEEGSPALQPDGLSRDLDIPRLLGGRLDLLP